MRITNAGKLIIQIVIIVGRFLLGRSGRRGTAENADPSNLGPVIRTM